MAIKVGVSLFGLSSRSFATFARKAEEVGVESLWVAEHLVFPAEIPPTYPYSESGRPPVNPSTPILDPWVTLAYVAAATSRIRLGTGVYILPLRNPFVTARAVATLDRLSEGRAILGVGIGWLREEFEAVGEGWEDRASRTKEIVEILRALWTQETIAYHGQHYSFGPVKFEPKPAQKPHPPIQFGGTTPAALRRAGALGDGWIAAGPCTPDEAREVVRKLDRARAEAGRLDRPFEVTTNCSLPPTPDNLRRYEEAGVTRVFLRPALPGAARPTFQDQINFLERIGNDVLAKIT